MAALFSVLALGCAGNAAFTAALAGRSDVSLAKAQALARAARFILFCGAICLAAAKVAA